MESFLCASKSALVRNCYMSLYSSLPNVLFLLLLQSQLSSYRTIRVVLGNQTCDLDSAVCALVQGLLEYVDAKKHGQDDVAVIPVMNIPEKEFRIKTEVVYSLRIHDIQPYLLTFR
jgi:hypothetical protein